MPESFKELRNLLFLYRLQCEREAFPSHEETWQNISDVITSLENEMQRLEGLFDKLSVFGNIVKERPGPDYFVRSDGTKEQGECVKCLFEVLDAIKQTVALAKDPTYKVRR